jgi:hypothetical protein
MVNVATRGLAPVLASTEYSTVPVPVPDAPEVTVTHVALLTTVQAQVDAVVIVRVPETPAAGARMIGMLGMK